MDLVIKQSPAQNVQIKSSSQGVNISMPKQNGIGIQQSGVGTDIYTLPTASETTKGGIKVDGVNTYMDEEVLKVKVPTKTSELENDSGFIDSETLSDYETTEQAQAQHDALKGLIGEETQERKDAITHTQALVYTEAHNRAQADIKLSDAISGFQGSLDTEKADREDADLTLNASIQAEKTARTNADTELQTNINAEKEARISSDEALETNINTIKEKIPNTATAENQLADKAFVNSSINAIAAYYVTSNSDGDAFPTKARLESGPYYFNGIQRTPTLNDYAIVIKDETKDGKSTRYTYTGNQWAYQYTLNDTAFTEAQVKALNSTITKELVDKFNDYDAGKQDKLTAGKYVEITSDNTVNVGIKAGTGISIDDDGTIANTQTSAEWGNITGTLSNQTDLQNALNGKQASLSDTQLNAVNSGITTSKVSTYDGYNQRITDNHDDINTMTVDISDLQTNKADKATTLSGYGIADAYTKTEIDGKIGDIETLLHNINSGA